MTGESGDLPAGEASQYAAGGDGSPAANGRMSQSPADQLQKPFPPDTIAGAMSQIPWMDQHAVLLETLTKIGQFEFPDPLERSYAALRAVVKYVDGNLHPSSRGLMRPTARADQRAERHAERKLNPKCFGPDGGARESQRSVLLLGSGCTRRPAGGIDPGWSDS